MPGETLVSCLMVTLATPGRLACARRAITAYCAQSHPRRELVIVVDPASPDGGEALRDHVAGLGRGDIRIVRGEDGASLGALRNRARAEAQGAVHCQWDDDDLHHPDRVARQLDALEASGAEGVCLQELMQFFPAERALYCANWRATESTAIPGSLACRADARLSYPEAGPDARLREDSDAVGQLLSRGQLHALAGQPHLYVYVSHGSNSWDMDHHRMLADRLGISAGLLLRREARLREGLAAFDFGPEPVTVRGPNGPAFVL
jgi:glycosyltransferase involved in cell wall biosynthesis